MVAVRYTVTRGKGAVCAATGRYGMLSSRRTRKTRQREMLNVPFAVNPRARGAQGKKSIQAELNQRVTGNGNCGIQQKAITAAANAKPQVNHWAVAGVACGAACQKPARARAERANGNQTKRNRGNHANPQTAGNCLGKNWQCCVCVVLNAYV